MQGLIWGEQQLHSENLLSALREEIHSHVLSTFESFRPCKRDSSPQVSAQSQSLECVRVMCEVRLMREDPSLEVRKMAEQVPFPNMPEHLGFDRRLAEFGFGASAC